MLSLRQSDESPDYTSGDLKFRLKTQPHPVYRRQAPLPPCVALSLPLSPAPSLFIAGTAPSLFIICRLKTQPHPVYITRAPCKD